MSRTTCVAVYHRIDEHVKHIRTVTQKSPGRYPHVVKFRNTLEDVIKASHHPSHDDVSVTPGRLEKSGLGFDFQCLHLPPVCFQMERDLIN